MPKFQALLKAMLLRRTKSSQIDGKPILTLPPKTIETQHCIFSEEEHEFYSALRNKTMIQFNKYLRANAIGKNYSNILVLLLRLRQAACHPHLINDIEHNAGEVEAGQMVELAKGLSRAVVSRLKDTGIEECPSELAIYLCHTHKLTKTQYVWILATTQALSSLVATPSARIVSFKFMQPPPSRTYVSGVKRMMVLDALVAVVCWT